MILTGGGEGDEAATGAGDGDQGCVEDGDAQDEDGDHPTGGLRQFGEAELEAQGGHHEAQEHGPAVAHEDPGRVEVPAQEAQGGAQDGCRQGAHQHLAAEGGEEQEKGRGYGRHAGAEAVHVVQDAEGGGDADDPEEGESGGEGERGGEGEGESVENSDADAGGDEDEGGEGHGDHEFHLGMQEAPVVEGAHEGQQGGAGQDADDLGAGVAVNEEDDGQDGAGVDGQTTQEGHGGEVHLARAGPVNDAQAQGELPGGGGEADGSD